MPTYCYVCECGYRKEDYLPIGQRDNTQTCPICHKQLVRLVGEGNSFNLNGKGFYKSGWDYSKGGN